MPVIRIFGHLIYVGFSLISPKGTDSLNGLTIAKVVENILSYFSLPTPRTPEGRPFCSGGSEGKGSNGGCGCVRLLVYDRLRETTGRGRDEVRINPRPLGTPVTPGK